MNVIFEDRVSLVTADEENANFPDDNVSNDSIRHVWKATSLDATLTLTVDERSDTITVFGTNATTITVTVKNLAETETLYGPTEYTLTNQDSIWSTYTYQSTQHKVILDFVSAAGTTVEAGIIRAGFGYVVTSPEYGLTEGHIDYTKPQELNNGSTYINQKPIVRKFSGTFKILREGVYASFMSNFIETVGKGPLPWLITDINDQDWSIFARMDGDLPSATHDKSDYATVNFDIIEMV